MGKASRSKGQRGEREVAEALRTIYPDARRGFQSRAGDDAADVEGTPFWVEVKRVKRNESIRAALAQAAEATDGRPVVVVSRCDGKPWVACMLLGDWLHLAEAGDA